MNLATAWDAWEKSAQQPEPEPDYYQNEDGLQSYDPAGFDGEIPY